MDVFYYMMLNLYSNRVENVLKRIEDGREKFYNTR